MQTVPPVSFAQMSNTGVIWQGSDHNRQNHAVCFESLRISVNLSPSLRHLILSEFRFISTNYYILLYYKILAYASQIKGLHM